RKFAARASLTTPSAKLRGHPEKPRRPTKKARRRVRIGSDGLRATPVLRVHRARENPGPSGIGSAITPGPLHAVAVRCGDWFEISYGNSPFLPTTGLRAEPLALTIIGFAIIVSRTHGASVPCPVRQ